MQYRYDCISSEPRSLKQLIFLHLDELQQDCRSSYISEIQSINMLSTITISCPDHILLTALSQPIFVSLIHNEYKDQQLLEYIKDIFSAMFSTDRVLSEQSTPYACCIVCKDQEKAVSIYMNWITKLILICLLLFEEQRNQTIHHSIHSNILRDLHPTIFIISMMINLKDQHGFPLRVVNMLNPTSTTITPVFNGSDLVTFSFPKQYNGMNYFWRYVLYFPILFTAHQTQIDSHDLAKLFVIALLSHGLAHYMIKPTHSSNQIVHHHHTPSSSTVMSYTREIHPHQKFGMLRTLLHPDFLNRCRHKNTMITKEYEQFETEQSRLNWGAISKILISIYQKVYTHLSSLLKPIHKEIDHKTIQFTDCFNPLPPPSYQLLSYIEETNRTVCETTSTYKTHKPKEEWDVLRVEWTSLCITKLRLMEFREWMVIEKILTMHENDKTYQFMYGWIDLTCESKEYQFESLDICLYSCYIKGYLNQTFFFFVCDKMIYYEKMCTEQMIRQIAINPSIRLTYDHPKTISFFWLSSILGYEGTAEYAISSLLNVINSMIKNTNDRLSQPTLEKHQQKIIQLFQWIGPIIYDIHTVPFPLGWNNVQTTLWIFILLPFCLHYYVSNEVLQIIYQDKHSIDLPPTQLTKLQRIEMLKQRNAVSHKYDGCKTLHTTSAFYTRYYNHYPNINKSTFSLNRIYESIDYLTTKKPSSLNPFDLKDGDLTFFWGIFQCITLDVYEIMNVKLISTFFPWVMAPSTPYLLIHPNCLDLAFAIQDVCTKVHHGPLRTSIPTAIVSPTFHLILDVIFFMCSFCLIKTDSDRLKEMIMFQDSAVYIPNLFINSIPLSHMLLVSWFVNDCSTSPLLIPLPIKHLIEHYPEEMESIERFKCNTTTTVVSNGIANGGSEDSLFTLAHRYIKQNFYKPDFLLQLNSLEQHETDSEEEEDDQVEQYFKKRKTTTTTATTAHIHSNGV